MGLNFYLTFSLLLVCGNSQDPVSNTLSCELCISEEQARIVVTQAHNLQSPDSSNTSTCALSDSQGIILPELQKTSQRFLKLEEKAVMDRQVLSGLVSQFQHHTNTVGVQVSVTVNHRNSVMASPQSIASKKVLFWSKDRYILRRKVKIQ